MKITRSSLKRTFSFSWRDLLVSAAILLCATGACALLHQTADTIDGFASPVYVLAVLLISRFTSGYLFGLIAAVLGVIGVNYVFTYPYMAFNFTISGYPLTMFTFLVVSLVTSTLTTKTKEQDRLRMENEKVKMRADLLRSVSHDIRTPLTSIMGATSAILENPALSPAEQQSLLVDVRDDAQWLIRIVENLLSITRISSEEAKVKKEPEPAEEVIESAVAKTHKHYPEVDIRVHLPDELMMVPMDPLLMEQVLVNLMENAVIHGETHHIDVTLSSEGNCAVFTVADDGRGIPQHLLPRLFDGSARSDRSSDGKRSMGIGLSVCRTIVLAHGGVIRGDNRQEGGAVFTVTLPMKGENDED